MAKPIPVDFDPFADPSAAAPPAPAPPAPAPPAPAPPEPAAPAPKAGTNAPKPVDFDPFAPPAKTETAKPAPKKPVAKEEPKEHSAWDTFWHGSLPKEKAPYKPRPISETLKEAVLGPTPEQEEQIRKLQGAAAQSEIAGAMNAPVGIAGAVGHYGGSPALENWAAKTSKSIEEFGSPPELTKSGAAMGRGVGELGAYYLLGKGAGAAADVIGNIPSVAKGLTAAGDVLAPYAAKAGSYLPKASDLVPETVKKGYRWLAGTTPEAEAAAAEAAAAETATTAQKMEKLTTAQKAIEGLKAGAAYTVKEVPKSTVGGGGVGGVMGAAAPRSEETQEARDQARWTSIIDGIKFGAGLGFATGLAGAFLTGVKGFWSSLSLEEQKKAVEEAEKVLKAQQEAASKMTTEAIDREGAKVTAATQAQTEAEAALSPTEKKLQELAAAKKQAELSPLVREEQERNIRNIRQEDPSKMDPRFMEQLQENIPEKLRAQRAEAERIAKETGMTKEQAETHVAEQQRVVDSAATHADDIAAKFAERPQMTGDELVQEIQPRAETMKKTLEATVKKDSGLTALEKQYGPEIDEATGKVIKPAPPVVATRPIIAEINKLLEKTSSKEVRAFLEDKKALMEKYESNGKINFALMDDIRKEVNDAMGSGIQAMGGTAKSAVGGQVARFDNLKSVVDREIFAGVPELEGVLAKYRQLKKPLDPFAKKGVFEDVTERKFGGDFKMTEGEVLKQLLSRTRNNREGLDKLIAETPELQDSVRRFLNGELFGVSPESAASVTAKKFDAFKKQNQQVIDRAGLTEEFNELANARRSAEQRISEAEKGLAGAKEEAAGNVKLREAAETEVERQKRLLNLQAIRETAIKEGKSMAGEGLEPRVMREPVAKEPGGPALPTREQLEAAAAKRVGRAKARIGRKETELEETAKPLRKTVKDAAEDLSQASTERENLKTLRGLVESTTSTADLESKLTSNLTRLRQSLVRRGHADAFPEEDFKAMLQAVQKAGDEYKRTGNELKFAQDLRTYAITRGLTLSGLAAITGGGYGVYRVGRGGE